MMSFGDMKRLSSNEQDFRNDKNSKQKTCLLVASHGMIVYVLCGSHTLAVKGTA